MSKHSRRHVKCKHAETQFFYKQPFFPVEPRVAIGRAQNEAESCYEVAYVFGDLWLK